MVVFNENHLVLQGAIEMFLETARQHVTKRNYKQVTYLHKTL